MKTILLLASALLLNSARGQTLQWNLVSPYPTGENLNAVTYGAGKFVAAGDSDVIYSDDAGISWKEGAGAAAESYKAVAYGNGKFVAASDHASVLTSMDGKKWTRHDVNTTLNNVTSLAFGNGVFVMTAGNAQVGHSTNGEDWTFTTEGITNGNGGVGGWVAFGNGRFVIAEYLATTTQGSMSFITSTDGTNWTRFAPNFPEVIPGCTRACPYWQRADGIAFAQGGFVTTALSSTLDRKVMFSTDGINYQDRGFVAGGPLPSLYALNDTVLLVASSAAPLWSANLADWNPLAGATPTLAGGYGAGTYVLVGKAGFVMRGSSLQTLQRIDSANKSGLLDGVAASGSTIVGIQGSSTPLLIVSTNSGRTFTSMLPPDTSGLLYDVAHDNGLFVAVGGAGTVIRSSDGLTWSKRLSNTSSDLFDVAYGGGNWVAVGANGKIISSADASIFSLRTSGTEVALNGVTHDGTNFVVVGANGIILTSTNAVDWSLTGTDEAKDLYTVAFGGGRYVAAGLGGIVHTWVGTDPRQTTTIPGTAALWVVYYNGRFVALDSGTANAFVSTDGLNWTPNPLPYGVNQAINVSDGRLWVSGYTSGFSSGSLIWTGLETPIVVEGTMSGGHFHLGIDVPQNGSYRVYRASNADAPAWQPLDLLTVSAHADWTDNDPVGLSAFYMVKREP